MNSPSQTRLFTFASGGWVLLLAGLVSLGLIIWAVAPAVLRMTDRPPGDGKNIDSYGFDLSTLLVPRSEIAPAMLHRDMVPALTNPATHAGADIAAINEAERGKYLVSSDRVIGVTIAGQSRAYPIQVMNVHDIVNDTLAGVPIAVTYNWHCDSVVVFDRRVNDQALEFGVSGLVYNSNLLMYDRPRANSTNGAASATSGGGESLWSQLLAKAVAGPAAQVGMTLQVLPSTLTRWDKWLAAHPDTSVIAREPRLLKRYKHASPDQYLRSDKIDYPVKPLPKDDGLGLKSRIIAVQVAERRRVYPVEFVCNRIAHSTTPNRWSDTLGNVTLWFECDVDTQTVEVTADPPEAPLLVTPALWFAWHATHPTDELATPPTNQHTQNDQ